MKSMEWVNREENGAREMEISRSISYKIIGILTSITAAANCCRVSFKMFTPHQSSIRDFIRERTIVLLMQAQSPHWPLSYDELNRNELPLLAYYIDIPHCQTIPTFSLRSLHISTNNMFCNLYVPLWQSHIYNNI